MIFDGLVKNVNNKVSKFLMYPRVKAHEHQLSPITHPPKRQYTRRARIAQSSALPPIADEPASPVRDVSQGEACPTDSAFIADQDRATIAKSSALPYDSAPRVTSPAAEEDSMQQSFNELTALCTSLQRQYSELLAKFQAQEVEINSDTEEVRLDEGEVAAKRASEDTKEMATVLTTMDAAIVLASGTAEVPTDSGSIPTAGPPAAEVPTGSDVVPTASPVFATATVVTPYRRRKGKEIMRRAKQIARDAEIARIHVEEELQSMIDGLDSNNETVAKYLEEYRQFSSELHMERRIELISDLEITEEVKSSDEVPKEKIKEIMQLVPIEEVYVEALQVKHPIIDWEHLDRDDLNQLWSLVKETLSKRPATSDKEMELWVELSRLYETNVEDQLWTYT
uniref:Uncharacterized protein n=1 Tax=Tanacetum cinerariifolium TaxID=118510 RepID=A0A699LD32_TANCI|nr:hypothetical protein [Tanacetum cinerariifolium]